MYVTQISHIFHIADDQLQDVIGLEVEYRLH